MLEFVWEFIITSAKTQYVLNVYFTPYFAFVYPHLHGIEIYGNTYHTYLSKLEMLNNKILWTVQKRPRRTHTTDLYKFYDTLPLSLLHNYQIAGFAKNLFNIPINYLLFFAVTSRKTHQFLIMILENKKPSYRWGTARRGRASWNLVKFCTNVDDLYLKSSETRLLPIRL